MRLLFGFIGAVAGALAAVFYVGSLASDTYLANKTFESPEDAMIYHSFIYLGTIAVCLIAGLILGRLIGRILDWIFG
ncbi:hypothetical protein NBRC116602_03980 [Hyphomicrobiales bacterium 4NK60-0047b]